MKFCEYCKTENSDYANFCENCGAPLKATEASQESASMNSYESSTMNSGESVQQSTAGVETIYAQGVQNEETKPVKTGASALSIVAFVLAFLIPIVGLILGIIDVAQEDGRSKGFSIAAICVSALAIIILVVAVIVPVFWMIDWMI